MKFIGMERVFVLCLSIYVGIKPVAMCKYYTFDVVADLI
jgi:hypothetical protein